MFKWILAAVVALSSLVAPAQTTRTFPALDTNNVFLARNSFPWVNNTLYAGSALYPTIQGAVTTACSIGTTMNVTVIVGTNAGVDITTLTGCAAVNVTDLRVYIPQYCVYGSAYTCSAGGGGGGGGDPAGVANDLQTNLDGVNLGADSGNLKNNSSTHNLFQKQLNNQPYASQYATANNTGINNALGVTGNHLVIANDGTFTDVTSIGATSGSVIEDRQTTTGSWGTRWNNCANVIGAQFYPSFAPFGVWGQAPCDADINFQTTAIGHGGFGPSTKSINSYAEGYGYDVGAGGGGIAGGDSGWAGSNNLLVSTLSYSAGITNMFSFQGYCYKVGDCNGPEIAVFCDSGYTAGSDQGCTFLGMNSGENQTFLTTTVATTTGTGDTKPTWVALTGTQHFSPGLAAIDISHAIVSGTLNSASTQYVTTGITLSGVNTNGTGQTDGTYALICSGGGGTGFTGTAQITGGVGVLNPTILTSGHGYTSGTSCTVASLTGTPATYFGVGLTTLNVWATSGTTLVQSTSGILQTYIAKSTVDNVNDIVPVTVSVQNGTFASGQVLWIASDSTPEMCLVTAAGAISGATQNISVSCHLPHGLFSLMFQGGTNGYVCFDADTALGWPFCGFAYGAQDTTHLIYGYLAKGTQAGRTLPGIGFQKATLTAPNNGFHVYKGAQILYTDKFSFGRIPTLNVNDTAWTVGDTVIVPHTAFSMAGLAINLQANTSQNGDGGAGVDIVFGGFNISKNFKPIHTGNGNPFGWYLGCDSTSTNSCLPVTGTQGWLNPIAIITVDGPFQSFAVLDGPPLPGGSVIGIHDTSSTPRYCLFCTDGSQGLFVDQINTRFEFSRDVLIDNNLVVGGGVGIQASRILSVSRLTLGDGTDGIDFPGLVMNMQFIGDGLGASNGLWVNEINGSLQHSSVTWAENFPGFSWFIRPDNSGVALTVTGDGAGNYHSDFTGNVNISGSLLVATHAVCLVTGAGCPILPFSFTTTAATTDVVTVTGMTSSGHCSIFATNATAGTMVQNATPTFIDTFATNSITVHHVATASATFSGICTPN